jgi:hypothetical protein
VAVSTAKHILIFPENKEPQIKFLHQENSHINHWLEKAGAVYPKPVGKGKEGKFVDNYSFKVTGLYTPTADTIV